MKHLKILGCLLAMFMAAVILFPGRALAAGDVAINSTNFPNAGFRAFVKKEFDKNKDGKLSAAEIKAVKKIDYSGKDCTSLKGIEFFTELKNLDCQRNKLKELDISKNTKLEDLYCYGNQIKTLDIRQCPWLEKIYTDPEDHYLDEEERVWVYLLYVIEDGADLDSDDPGIEYWLCFDEGTTILSKPTIHTQPKAKTAEVGEKVSFKVAARGKGLSYQWYYKKPGSSTWTKVASASGKKAALTLTVAARHYDYKYRCKVSNADGYVYSRTVKLTVDTKPVITSPTQAVTKTVKKGTTVKLTVRADAAETYKWYYRTSRTGKWTAVTALSGKKATYQFKAALKHKGWQYRCKVSNDNGYVYSKVFTLKVTS